MQRLLVELSFESHSTVLNILQNASRLVPGLTQPPNQPVPGALSLGIKRPGSEADHSPPSISEAKNVWIFTFTPPYAFMAWCSVKKGTGTTLPLP
jgi:hypothetical protein